jgi:hypothetical protein
MKTNVIHERRLLWCVFLAVVLIGLARAGTPSSRPAPASERPGTEPDPGTQLVASFYSALLQSEAPTLAQETALFHGGGLRRAIAHFRGLKESDPVILTTCRENKELFLPRGIKPPRSLKNEIGISSTFTWASLGRAAQPSRPGFGVVLVRFTDNPDGPVEERVDRSIAFWVSEGKLSFEMITFGEWGRKSVRDIPEFTKGFPTGAELERMMIEEYRGRGEVKPAP